MGTVATGAKICSHHNALCSKNRRAGAEGEEMVLGQLAVVIVILQKGCLEEKPVSSELWLVLPEFRV